MDSLVNHQTSLLEDPLLQNEGTEQQYYTGDGSIDIRGRPVLKTKTGKWKACSFILGSFFCERLAFYGVSTNLVNYLIEKLHQGNVSAARNVTTWQGTCYLTPLIGAILADTYLGRYWTIAGFVTVYLLGTCTLTLSASVHSLKPAQCTGFICPSATPAQYTVFFLGLYLIALGTGGLKPCIWPFGADQFDDTDKTERTKKGTYFNLFYFSQNIGAIIASTLLVWIQDDVGWGIGFGVSALLIGLASASLFSGTFLYRLQRPGGSPLIRICQVLVAAFHKRKLNSPENCGVLYETEGSRSAIKGSRKLDHTNELRCLDKAALVSEIEESDNPWRLCTVTQVEEVKILARMVPILATGIVFSAVFAQMPTLFVEQGKAMDRRIIGSFTVPAASLSLFNHVTVVVLVPIYDRLVVPAARRHTGRERGFSQLQRMGAGLFVSILCMSTAAALEAWCLKVAGSHAQVSILWQVPQYFLMGSAEVFTFVGQHEFFYEQAPDAMRSLCSALSLLTNSLGNYLSSALITAVTYATSSGGNSRWIPDDLDHGHLDYFFWLLAALSAVNLLVYLVCASKYEEKKTSSSGRFVL